jgi:hypothetical protein
MDFQYGLSDHDYFLGMATELSHKYALPYRKTSSWYTDAHPQAPENWDIVGQKLDGLRIQSIFISYGLSTMVTANLVAIVEYSQTGAVWCTLWGSSKEYIEEQVKLLQKLLPTARILSKREVPISFWAYDGREGHERPRKIAVPTWEDIEENYPEETRKQISSLVTWDPSKHLSGQLILWHGVPGTGKTYALRSLMWEWRSWARFHYIADIENFFGTYATYMLAILLGEEEDPGDEKNKLWRVIILEDAGEMLTGEARERTGQALSRLLNVTEGLIGQGLKILVLITTNEEMKTLHPAVSRPGRCLAHNHFLPFSSEQGEMEKWLQKNGLPFSPDSGPQTLAQLYAKFSANKFPTPKSNENKSIGF